MPLTEKDESRFDSVTYGSVTYAGVVYRLKSILVSMAKRKKLTGAQRREQLVEIGREGFAERGYIVVADALSGPAAGFATAAAG